MSPPADPHMLRRVTATKRYSNGSAHFAYDYAMPIGTPLFAISDGVILGCNDGVRDQPRGKSAGSGAPSNWVLLGTKWKGKKVTVYYQHMTRGLRVKTGQKVKEGQPIGASGNSGNTTGPHLHIAASWGYLTSRYAYLANGGNNKVVIFPTPNIWAGTKSPIATVRLSSLKPGSRNTDVKTYQQALRAFGMAKHNPAGVTGYYGTETKAMTRAAYRKLGWLDGNLNVPGPQLLAKLGLKVS
ncbi:MAG TPA: peptidoglycan DD-metalloendopeptidase family protein [Jiangellaceae bacterium]